MRTIEILREYFVIFSRNISRSLIDNDFTIKLSLRKETSLSIYFIADFMVGSKKEKNEKKIISFKVMLVIRASMD